MYTSELVRKKRRRRYENVCLNLFIGAAAQIRAVYKDHKILVTYINKLWVHRKKKM